MPVFRVATRASALAQTQTRAAIARLADAYERRHDEAATFDIQTVRTIGDRHRADWDAYAASLTEDERARKWSLEIENAVARGDFDLAIHSAKDLPFRDYEGTTCFAIGEREAPNDVFIPKTPGIALQELPQGAVIGTNSNRRRANTRALRPDLAFADYGGNVTTRLDPAQMEAKSIDGAIMAAAGLKRLDVFDADVMQVLPTDLFPPAANQGVLAAQLNSRGDARLREAVLSLQHRETALAWKAERSFLEMFDAGCDTPISVFASLTDENLFRLSAWAPQRHQQHQATFERSSPLSGETLKLQTMEVATLARALAEDVIKSGAREHLATPEEFR